MVLNLDVSSLWWINHHRLEEEDAGITGLEVLSWFEAEVIKLKVYIKIDKNHIDKSILL